MPLPPPFGALSRNAINLFIEKHPAVNVELILSDGYVDLTGQGIDLAVRFGDLKDSSLNAVRLGANQRIVCAAPNYLQQFGRPQIPSDLMQHNCLLMRFSTGIDREWIFTESGQRRTITVTGNRIANDGYLVRQWCLQGYGIALKSYWDIKEDLAEGRLEAVLSKYANTGNNLQVVYQGGKSIPRRVRALIDALVMTFSQQQLSAECNSYKAER